MDAHVKSSIYDFPSYDKWKWKVQHRNQYIVNPTHDSDDGGESTYRANMVHLDQETEIFMEQVWANNRSGKDPVTISEVLSGPDAAEWREATDEEVNRLTNSNVLAIVTKETGPNAGNLMEGRWAFKTKRLNDGSIGKDVADVYDEPLDNDDINYGENVDYARPASAPRMTIERDRNPILDSGATRSMHNNRINFVDFVPFKEGEKAVIMADGRKSMAAGHGTWKLLVLDNQNKPTYLNLQDSLLLEDLTTPLVSASHILKSGGEVILKNGGEAHISFPGKGDKRSMCIPLAWVRDAFELVRTSRAGWKPKGCCQQGATATVYSLRPSGLLSRA